MRPAKQNRLSTCKARIQSDQLKPGKWQPKTQVPETDTKLLYWETSLKNKKPVSQIESENKTGQIAVIAQ